MSIRSIRETARQAIQDVIAPPSQAPQGEIAGLRGEMGQIEKRMEEGFASVRSEVSSTNRRLDDTLDIRERPAALEAALTHRRQ